MVASACCVQGNDASCCFGGGATAISFLATASAAPSASAATPTSSTSGATGKIAAVGYYFSIASGGFIFVCFFFSRIVLQTSCRCNVRLVHLSHIEIPNLIIKSQNSCSRDSPLLYWSSWIRLLRPAYFRNFFFISFCFLKKKKSYNFNILLIKVRCCKNFPFIRESK